MRKIYLTAIFCIIIVSISATESDAARKRTYITIGTGAITGQYYPTGGAIARIVNKNYRTHGIRCTIQSTGGSVYNVNAIKAGEIEFGIVQSDRLYQAWTGKADWRQTGTIDDLRSVFSIYAEAVTIVAAVDKNIKSMDDLRGKRVNIGSPGSGQRQNAIDALEMAGINYQKELRSEYYRTSQLVDALHHNRIDAFFYTTGHPSGLIKEATSGPRKVRFIPVMNIERLVNYFSYYSKATIPIEYYPSALNRDNIKTFGVKATLVASERVPDFIVYRVVREIFKNFESFKKLHPTFKFLDKGKMIETLSVPIHRGALKYYREAGLM